MQTTRRLAPQIIRDRTIYDIPALHHLNDVMRRQASLIHGYPVLVIKFYQRCQGVIRQTWKYRLPCGRQSVRLGDHLQEWIVVALMPNGGRGTMPRVHHRVI